jgi:carboxymethylenebutenolidase
MNITSRKLTRDQDGIPGWIAHPSSAGRHPGVMMVHHAPGLTGDYKFHAAALARLGFTVLVPGVYNMLGVAGDHHHTMGAEIQAKHGDADFLAVLDTAWNWLRSRPDTDPQRTALVGHCLGGRLGIPFAADHPELAALVLFYATIRDEERTPMRPRHSFDTAKLVKCPTQVFYGGKDYLTPNAIQQKLWQSFLEGATPLEWHFFSTGLHGFASHDSDGYQPVLGEISTGLLTGFLNRALGA